MQNVAEQLRTLAETLREFEKQAQPRERDPEKVAQESAKILTAALGLQNLKHKLTGNSNNG